ncbi:MAG: hypothetical protein RQ885_05800 [Desulfurococcales archaeon]|jgi:hypothetical protein|nr:hypothetical protein [Desulfurococcales archaeon]
MPALRRIKISDLRKRGRRIRDSVITKGTPESIRNSKEEDLHRLELETLYMIGAPAC